MAESRQMAAPDQMPGPDRTPDPAAGIRVIAGIEHLERDGERLMFAIGVFDGLHRGHRYLLARLRAAAAARGARPAVLTFDAHPDAIILGHAPPVLVDPQERLLRLARAGVAVTVVEHFDDALRRTPYDAFVRTIAERTHLAGFLMTPEAAFGHQRRGTPEALADLGAAMHYDVVVVPPYQLDGGPIRSQRIREEIARGDLIEATRLLGRSHAVVGELAGDGRVHFSMPVSVPPAGHYAARVSGAWRPGWRGRPAVATVDAGGLSLSGGGQPRSVRVAFMGRLP
jgi:riboflavin kinase/FMN adenylyltransferase